MRSPARNLRLCIVVATGIGLLVAEGGCWIRNRPAPPGPREISGEIPELKSASERLPAEFQFLQWREGLNLLIVDGLSHFNVRSGHRYYYDCEGSAGSSKEYGPGYNWRIDTRDGKTATFRFDDKEYDLSEGALFVVKANGDKVEVHQLNRDLSPLPWDRTAIADFLKNDAEIRKILGVKAEEK
ncbi:MAG TPA: hypothetical protein VGG61_06570 [Gemmataceae bacterium]